MQRYMPGTALLVVDVQNDSADAAGSLYVRGGEKIVPIINGRDRVGAGRRLARRLR